MCVCVIARVCGGILSSPPPPPILLTFAVTGHSCPRRLRWLSSRPRPWRGQSALWKDSTFPSSRSILLSNYCLITHPSLIVQGDPPPLRSPTDTRSQQYDKPAKARHPPTPVNLEPTDTFRKARHGDDEATPSRAPP